MVVFIVVQKFAGNKVLSECCDYYNLLVTYLLYLLTYLSLYVLALVFN